MKSEVPKINGGVITSKLGETKQFYTEVLGFKVKYESDWYCLMHCPDNSDSEIAFLSPNHPSQARIFQSEYSGSGVWFTYEVKDVDSEYKRLQALDIPIELDLRDEDWGDRHFAIKDPNGVGIDVVTHSHHK